MSGTRSTGAPSPGRAGFCPRSNLRRDDFFDLIFIERCTVVGVEPAALDRNRISVHVGRHHLELTGPERGQLSDQVLVASAFLEQVANFLDVLRLGEPSDEGRVGLSEDFVVHVTDVLCGQHTCYTVLSRLLENQFDEVLCWWIAWVWGKVRRYFVHEEQQFEFPIGRLLCEHPIVEFAREFLDEVLLLILVLNGVQVHDVERNFSRDRRLNKRIDVDGDAVGKQQLIHARRKGCQPASEIVPCGFGQTLFEVRQAMFHHHLVPRRWVHTFFFIFGKALRVEMANELLMWFTNDASQRLEITNVQTATGPLHQDFVKERLDRLTLCFFHVKPGQVRKPSRHHVPRRDGLFRVQVGGWGAERVDAQRQPFAAKRRPNSHFTTVQQLLGPSYDSVLFLQFLKVNTEG